LVHHPIETTIYINLDVSGSRNVLTIPTGQDEFSTNKIARGCVPTAKKNMIIELPPYGMMNLYKSHPPSVKNVQQTLPLPIKNPRKEVYRDTPNLKKMKKNLDKPLKSWGNSHPCPQNL